jgi:hypothetical protein
MEFGATAIIFIVTVAFAVAGARATLWTVLYFLTRPKVQYEPVDGRSSEGGWPYPSR